MSETLNPAAQIVINKMRAEQARKLLDQKRVEQALLDQQLANQKAAGQNLGGQTLSERLEPEKSADNGMVSGQNKSSNKKSDVRVPDLFHRLLNKTIRIYLGNNSTPITGTMKAYSPYEIQLETSTGRIILMKHAISFIEEVTPIQAP